MIRTSVNPTIVGLGMTEIGKVYGPGPNQFAQQAVRLAVADAGLRLSDLDGLLVASGVAGGVSIELQRDLNLRDLSLIAGISTWGTSMAVMIQLACMAIETGQATTIACVFADAPLQDKGRSFGASFSDGRPPRPGWRGLTEAAGILGGNPLMAMNARRHMLTYGTTSEQFGHVAVAQREWALLNPQAQMKKPITLADHQESRWIVEPFHLLDCCLVSNGGVAVIVTSANRAADLRQPPVKVAGFAQCNPGYFDRHDENFGLVSGAVKSGPAALKMAGVTIDDVDVVQFYDCYTYTVVVTLEDYGFCRKGEGGEFVASGVLGPGGSLPLNTGGGQLSSFYLQGATPVSEGIIQARGHGGARQAVNHDVVLVSNNGGSLDHHTTLVLTAGAA
ncbi:thiolase family protein [Rhodococcus sp. WS3]|uniref:thiolase family protein n=1 Tax=Rhodococcus sp. WS3 TaxID=2486271 RepID=UPI001142CBC6|nr:thiolase family protein [Rhodococcus sp. WS3]ROZ49028.1 thiolase family protein [Rhodococcus sp. WS3]